MQVIKCNQPTYFDVGVHLISVSSTLEDINLNGIWFEHDYEDGRGTVHGTIVPHKAHVGQLVKHALRGHTIIVWSAGGEKWCAAVCKALEIEKFVTLCIAKPIWAYDDKQANDFIKTQYMEDK